MATFSGQGPTEEEKAHAAEIHQRAAEIVAQHDMTLAIEPLNRFEAYFLNTLADAAAYVRRIGHPSFGAMYDTFHANIEERDPVGCLGIHLDVVRHVHVSENDRGTPGRGHILWAETFQALCRGGYNGWLTVEAFGRALPELAATTSVWRDLSASDGGVCAEGYRLIRSHWKE